MVKGIALSKTPRGRKKTFGAAIDADGEMSGGEATMCPRPQFSTKTFRSQDKV